jgi:hypothetical protein
MARTTEAGPKPRGNVYVGMLAMSLLVMVSMSVMLYLEYDKYKTAPQKPAIDVPGATAAKAGAK